MWHVIVRRSVSRSRSRCAATRPRSVFQPRRYCFFCHELSSVVSERDPTEAEAAVMAAARAALPAYMVPAAVHVLRQFAMSSSGKVDRQALKAQAAAAQQQVETPPPIAAAPAVSSIPMDDSAADAISSSTAAAAQGNLFDSLGSFVDQATASAKAALPSLTGELELPQSLPKLDAATIIEQAAASAKALCARVPRRGPRLRDRRRSRARPRHL